MNCRPLHYQWSALPLSYGSVPRRGNGRKRNPARRPILATAALASQARAGFFQNRSGRPLRRIKTRSNGSIGATITTGVNLLRRPIKAGSFQRRSVRQQSSILQSFHVSILVLAIKKRLTDVRSRVRTAKAPERGAAGKPQAPQSPVTRTCRAASSPVRAQKRSGRIIG